MPLTMRCAIILAIIVYFIVLVVLLKQKRLSLRYTLLWLFSGMILLLLVVFPQLLDGISSLLGFQVQSNALFAILFFFTLLIMMSLTSIISKQNGYIKKLAQHTALLEKRLRNLESDKPNKPDEVL